MEKELEYPVGSFIEWCNEYYKVLSNFADWGAKVVDMEGCVNNNFYFKYEGEKARLITDEDKIAELTKILEQYSN